MPRRVMFCFQSSTFSGMEWRLNRQKNIAESQWGYTSKGATKLGRPTKLQQSHSLTRTGIGLPGAVFGPLPSSRLLQFTHGPQSPAATEYLTMQGGGQTCDVAECAKNLWVWTGRHWELNLATFNTRTLSREASLAGIFEELSGIAWVIIGLSEVRRTGEAYTVLTATSSATEVFQIREKSG